MKQGQKILLFSSVVLGSVLAGTVSAQADTYAPRPSKPRPTATQIIEKQDKASAEDLAVAKEIFAEAAKPAPSNRRAGRDINTEIIEKQDIQTEEDRAIAEEIFGNAASESTTKTETPAPVEKKDELSQVTPSQPAVEAPKGETQPTPAEKKDEPTQPKVEAQPAPAVTPEAEKTAPVTISLDQSVATIHYDRPAGQAKTNILHYVWSADEASDQTKWLQAGKSDTKIDLNELGGYGVYNINSYKDVDGNLMLFNKASVTYKKPATTPAQEAQPHVEVTSHVDGDTLTVQLKRGQDLGKALVQYAVWSEENGQDDVQWYVASQTTKIDLSKHKGYGKYHLHTYAWLNGQAVGLAANDFIYLKKEAPKPAETPAPSTTSLPAQGMYHFTSRVPIKNQATLASPAITYFDKGMSVYYDKVLENDGHQWIGYVSYSGQRHYVDLGAIAKAEASKPVAQPESKVEDKKVNLPAQGTYHFTGRASIKNDTKLSSPEIAYFDKGMSVNYDKVLENDGHQWIGYVSYSGQRHYVDLGAIAKAEASKPAAQPESKVEDKKVNLPAQGTYHFTGRASIKNDTKLSSPEIAYFDKGMSVNYDKVLENDGHQWIGYVSYSGQRHYVDLGAIAKVETPKPAPKAEPKVEEKKVNLPSSGTYTFTGRAGIKAEPKAGAQDLAFYDKGQSVNYDKTLTADGKDWISYLSYSGHRRYIAVGNANPASTSAPTTPAPTQATPAAKDEPTNLVYARLAFAQHGLTSTFDVEVTDLTGKGIVRFAVWNGQNDQDDLEWHEMKRVGDKFVGSFDMNNHRGNGPLYIHAYYQEKPGAKMQFVRGLQF